MPKATTLPAPPQPLLPLHFTTKYGFIRFYCAVKNGISFPELNND
ncbi:hypothetical protein HMPREF9370_1425 [Neisseria wadsworthii 9715]|uniref:Uncharacterized protein n=1 Tax=Neisseria wadsworthii 9715 TaxID=1030841 RepID=G4CQR5_9NEIS|nr:hypothetical protein HMPREF9370_1425 [Neisseria wadsworthii 9715]